MCSHVSLCLPLLELISTNGCGATKWDCSDPSSSDSHLPSNPTRTVRLTFDMPQQTGATSFITWMWGVMIGVVVGGRGVLGGEELLKGKETFMYMYKTCRHTEKNLPGLNPIGWIRVGAAERSRGQGWWMVCDTWGVSLSCAVWFELTTNWAAQKLLFIYYCG